MGVFKPTIHRKSFIDKKIRENSFPTAVTIASDYLKEFGRTVDPRTIAADIASLKHDYNAPISYDHQKRGYYYSDPSFHLNLLPSATTDIPLDNLVPESFPPSAFLPEWQQKLIAAMVEKLIPNQVNTSPLAGKISVLLDKRAEAESNLETLINALGAGNIISLDFRPSSSIKPIQKFQPIQLIYSSKETFLFGLDVTVSTPLYRILNSTSINTVSVHAEQLPPPRFVYVQSTNNEDIEILLSEIDKDTILVFSADKNNKELIEYALLAKTDLYHA